MQINDIGLEDSKKTAVKQHFNKTNSVILKVNPLNISGEDLHSYALEQARALIRAPLYESVAAADSSVSRRV